jgi:hypothetical protein
MKSAEDRGAGPTVGTVNPWPGTEFIVTDGICGRDSPQVGLTEDDDVIEAFPVDRADQSLRLAVLPG